MADASMGFGLGQAIILMGAGVIAVPLFRRLGLGSVLGYLAAGLSIGPFGLGLINDPQALLHIAELGVVMFLFIIGLEMRPRKLWNLRKQIFGLGAAQVLLCGALLTLLGMAAGLPPAVAAAGAMGFVLSSTAVIMQMLNEAGDAGTEEGQKAISILLLEDLAIVPLLALVAFWAAFHGAVGVEDAPPVWQSIGLALAALAALIAAGRWLLDPLFGLIARAGAREVLTAAALLIVLGSAVLLDAAGLSMAMGAFLAGVLLSESSYRHELEADVEPFRGILLGLFFISVGMSLDLSTVLREWQLVLGGVLAFMVVKAIGIYAVARLMGSAHSAASHRAALFAQGGEFAFVLYGAALAVGLFDARIAAIMSAIVILSMALTPLVLIVQNRMRRNAPVSLDGVDKAKDLTGRILCIGFGRFAQVASQALLARRFELSLIENDVEMIQAAGNFGFKVYYGDGTRLDVLHASGAGRAEAILVCVDKPDVADKIVELCRHEFPLAKLYVRAFDRGHSLRLIKAGVDYQIRETFESALAFSEAVLTDLGVDEDDAREAIEDVRERDAQRVELQLVGGITAGRSLMRGNMVTPEPEPFFPPQRAEGG
ncbi:MULTISPECIES: monovalent cation:proton antiporter-2 (CPA2) family protein [unclassified Sphingobium]|uniref:monovalent cation:proton antiporter-2 (CPA2) family protein n=1 Tax=unclassified Sphingobium TaxID=2611147 RepID=UPI00222467A4|nr:MULTISPECIES: monovalent cation:proton antiporter-2 (CPA2) family protein [unclassified Sphingobium]MCW2368510.1 glutathione-regulated potassium-efflux system protein KefB [Sphingobium sp. B11D3D]MCW2410998.1 glutathione-regulated potassium-efflux system protein KefB [Sphingobium sp. B8D3D]MCW2416711.1 glutathione-regulated potassium-efflux system protein KefB [Sphingobium sp. B8D3A]